MFVSKTTYLTTIGASILSGFSQCSKSTPYGTTGAFSNSLSFCESPLTCNGILGLDWLLVTVADVLQLQRCQFLLNVQK